MRYAILIIAAVAVGTISLVDAQRGWWGGPGAGTPQPDLTDEEQQLLTELRTGHQKQMIDLRAKMEKLWIELDELVAAGEGDVDDKVEQLGEQWTAMQKAMITHRLEVQRALPQIQHPGWARGHGGWGRGAGRCGFEQSCGMGRGRGHRWGGAR